MAIGLQGPPDAAALAVKVREAARTARYAGVRRITMRRDGQLMEFREAVSKNGRLLRIEYLDGPFAGRIVVENGRERRQFSPSDNEIVLSPARSNEGTLRFLRGRRATWTGGPEVAGRPTYQATSGDEPGNVRQRTFVDTVTGVVLKRAVYDSAGAPVGGFEFLTIDFSPRLPGSLFRLDRKGAKVVTPADTLRALVARGGFSDVTLPASSGYALDGARVIDVLGQRVLVQSFLRQGDRVTLFQTPEGLDKSRLRRLARPPVRLRTWNAGGRSYALLGSVPEAEIDRLAKIVGG